MKKNYFKFFKKTSRRTVAYIFLSVVSLSLLLYSCKKIAEAPGYKSKPPIDAAAIITEKDLINWYNSIPVIDNNNLNSVSGLKTGGGKLPFPIQWNKAQQRVINGKHIVKVPVSKDALMVFEKEGKNGALNAYAYKWHEEKGETGKFSGEVARFSFQDYSMYGQKIINGKAGKLIKFKSKDQITPMQIKTAIEEYQASKLSSISTNSRKLKTQSFLGDALRAVGNALGALGCTLTGGSWDNGPGGDWTNNTNGSFSASCDDQIWDWDWSSIAGDPGAGEINGQIIEANNFLQLNATRVDGSSSSGSTSDGSSSSGSGSDGSGSGGWDSNPFSRLTSDFWTQVTYFTGGNYTISSPNIPSNPTPPAPISQSQINDAIDRIGLNADQQQWLNQFAGDQWASDIVNYLTNVPYQLTDKQKYQLQTHINLLKAQDQAYITVVNNYGRYHNAQVAVNPTMVTSYMWWDNIDWVDYSLLNANEQNTEAYLSTFNIAVVDMEFLDRLAYPNLAKIVDGLYKRVKPDYDLQTQLVKFSNLSIDKILSYLQPGKGPKIVLKDYTGDAADNTYGEEDSETIYINRKYAEHLNTKVPYQPDPNFEFFIMVVILHEFVHFGNDVAMDRFPTNPYNWDAGAQFEDAAFGGHVDYDLTTGKMKFVKTH